MNFWLTSQDTLEVNDLVTDLAVMYDCDDNVSGCDDDNVDDYDDDNDDDNYDDNYRVFFLTGTPLKS